MQLSYDPAKNLRNESERGISFEAVALLDWSSALIQSDERKDYGEPRFRVLGFIEGRLHALVFTPRAGRVHVISLRKANPREIKHHAQATHSG